MSRFPTASRCRRTSGRLYVSNSDWPKDALLMQFPVSDDLTLGDGGLFFDTGHLIGESVTTARQTAFKSTAPAMFLRPGLTVCSSVNAGGKHLGTIVMPEVAANIGWGDDGRTLYITASKSLYRIRLSTDGLNYREH